jgi:hypothetical protein
MRWSGARRVPLVPSATAEAKDQLHHPPADESRHDEAHGEAVVRRERLAVLHVGEDDVGAGSMATACLRLVPYLRPPPPATSSAPLKHTLSTPAALPMTPHHRSTSRRRALHHTEAETAPGPQLKPADWRTMFSSLRRFPAHTPASRAVPPPRTPWRAAPW